MAASLEGYYSQDSPMYGPERRGAPVASFVRVSTEPVNERGYISNPDVVVVFDPSLLSSKQVDPLQGLSRTGVMILNGAAGKGSASAVTVDASSLATRFLGRNSISAAMAASTCKVLGIASLENTLGAVRIELEEVGLAESDVAKNVALAKECYNLTKKTGLPGRDGPGDMEGRLVDVRYEPPHLSTAYLLATGNSPVKKTGSWRTSRPVIDYAKCTKCMVCFVYCPDSSISLDADLTPRVDYDNCKGCMICLTECPPRAIAEEMVS